MRSNVGKCAAQCTVSPLVSTNPRRLVEGPILLIFYQVRASTFHHYDRSMYVYGLRLGHKFSEYTHTLVEYAENFVILT